MGRGISVRQVIDTVKSVSGVDFRVDEGPRRAGDPAAVTATGEKVRELLGWTPAHDDLREMVSTALEWEQYLSDAQPVSGGMLPQLHFTLRGG